MHKNNMSALKWTKGYKYRLEEKFEAHLPLRPGEEIVDKYNQIILLSGGTLMIEPGFSWDGASGVTFDTDSSMRGALIHDALYLLIRQGKLSLHYRKAADEILRDVCIIDGMWKWRARKWFQAVQAFGFDAASKLRKVFTFPKEK